MNIPCRINPLGVDGGNIPIGYTRLDYLESPYGFDTTGYIAYFDIAGYKPNFEEGDSIKIETEHQVQNVPSNYSSGGNEGFNRNAATFVLGISYKTRLGLSTGGYQDNVVFNNYVACYDTKSENYDYAIGDRLSGLNTNWHRLTISLDKTSFKIIDNDYQETIPTRTPLAWGLEARLCVFGTLGLDQYYSTRPFTGRKKYFKFWLNDELKHHLVPCLDETSTPCMVDLVTGETYYNAGSGLDFIPSPT